MLFFLDAIQGLGALLVESIDGNYSNVVGLPLPVVRRLLGDVGHDLRSFCRPDATSLPEARD